MRKREHIISLLLAVLLACPLHVWADENLEPIILPVEPIVLPTENEEIISVVLPTVPEESPLDFYIDTQGLIYATGAIKYGGGRVEEGAHLLFRNHGDGEYDFSSKSDPFTIINKSTVPVDITVTAHISDLGAIEMADRSFFSVDTPVMYLALIDDFGNESLLTSYEDASFTVRLREAALGAYTYIYDEFTGTYVYGHELVPDNEFFESYSFGLIGDCNESDEWMNIMVSPRVSVTWDVNPILQEKDQEVFPELPYLEAVPYENINEPEMPVVEEPNIEVMPEQVPEVETIPEIPMASPEECPIPEILDAEPTPDTEPEPDAELTPEPMDEQEAVPNSN